MSIHNFKFKFCIDCDLFPENINKSLREPNVQVSSTKGERFSPIFLINTSLSDTTRFVSLLKPSIFWPLVQTENFHVLFSNAARGAMQAFESVMVCFQGRGWCMKRQERERWSPDLRD